MFALEFAPLLTGNYVSVLGLTLGWLLQWGSFSTELPVYNIMCAAFLLYYLPLDMGVPIDVTLLTLIPVTTLLDPNSYVFMVLHVLAIVYWPTLHPISVFGDGIYGTLLTTLWVQAPLKGFPYSATRLITALLFNRLVLTYTALFSAIKTKTTPLIAAFLVMMWLGADWQLPVLVIVGTLEWLYRVQPKLSSTTTQYFPYINPT